MDVTVAEKGMGWYRNAATEILQWRLSLCNLGVDGRVDLYLDQPFGRDGKETGEEVETGTTLIQLMIQLLFSLVRRVDLHL